MHDKPDNHDHKHINREDILRKLGHDHHKDAHQKEVVERLTPLFRQSPSSPAWTYLQTLEALLAAHIVSYPFVFFKTRAQLNLPSNLGIIKEIGLPGVFKGVTPYLYASALKGAIQSAFIPSGTTTNPKKPEWKKYLSAFGPLVLILGINTVAENVQTKMIHDAALGRNSLTGVGNIILREARTNGYQSVFRGFVPYSASIGIFSLVNHMVFSNVKADSTPFDIFFKNALPANLICSVFTNPFEVIKTQFQALDGHNVTFKQVIAKEGVKKLFTKGLAHFALRNITFSLIFVMIMPKAY